MNIILLLDMGLHELQNGGLIACAAICRSIGSSRLVGNADGMFLRYKTPLWGQILRAAHRVDLLVGHGELNADMRRGKDPLFVATVGGKHRVHP
ncbi:MAG: hypothetical protein AUJ92_04450 [Armatimonadetes bacterium CG2_30_59_28]|nr:MAG: hypothetical protein AUJ92_04450 [Armatimonadetes bacterium CG2_30_59_28]PIU67594.1 MAG: hypothetical protein COS85_00045 [Armatimonadetes bacterium CG07_land_8_20_14_0_80_59_28]